MYFIHSWKDVGSRYLFERKFKDSEPLIHGEFDIQGKVWHPVTAGGEAYRPVRLKECFHKEHWYRFGVEELNVPITAKDFNTILGAVKRYKD